MKKFRLLFILACGITASSASWALTLTAAPGGGLAFGSFVAGSTSGTVIVTPGGARSKTGGVILISSESGHSAAVYTVTGTADTTYSITLPADGIVALSLGSNHMEVNTFISTPVATSASTGLLTGGSQTLRVGATLSVDASMDEGLYEGTFTVTVVFP